MPSKFQICISANLACHIETRLFNNICAVPALKAYFGKGFSNSNWYPLSEITFLLLFNFNTAWEKLPSKVLESSATQATASCKNLGAVKEPKKQPWKFKSFMQRAKLLIWVYSQWGSELLLLGDFWGFMNLLHPRGACAKGLYCCWSPLRAGLDTEGWRTYIENLYISNILWGRFLKKQQVPTDFFQAKSRLWAKTLGSEKSVTRASSLHFYEEHVHRCQSQGQVLNIFLLCWIPKDGHDTGFLGLNNLKLWFT